MKSWLYSFFFTWGLASFSLATASPIVLDFDTDAAGNPIVAGQVIDTEYAGFGVTIGVTNLGGGPDLAVAFDSANPTGGDPDLETPNPAGHITNTVPYENVLIAQENGADANADGFLDAPFVPDDEAGGAQFVFSLDFDAFGADITLLDIESSGGTVKFFHNGSLVQSISIPSVGDSSVQTVSLSGNPFFDTFVVNLPDSGAIGEVVLEAPEPSTWLLMTTLLAVAIFAPKRHVAAILRK